jgi:hypothetical protein
MNSQLHYVINSGLCWFIVLMALVGYILTLKRMKQRWPFWVILSVGWAFLAISNSLAALGVNQGTPYLLAIWLSSYVLVFASLVLMFIKLVESLKGRS